MGGNSFCKTKNFVPLTVPGLSSSSGTRSSSTSPPQDSSSTSSNPELQRSDEQAPGDQRDSTKSQNKNKKESNNQATGDRLRDLPGWLEEFTDNLEDTGTPVLADIPQDSESERPTKVVSKFWKHSIYTHFPKDRNCEVCLRTKMTRALCRRPTGDAVPRATEFGDLITADHTVLNEEGESRNNHRYAVVPCKNQVSRETERSSRKFLEPSEKPKVIYTNHSWERGKSCEDLSWNHRTPTPHRSETNGISETAGRRVKEGTSAVLLQSGVDGKWWDDYMECYCYLRNVQDLLADGKTPYERRFGEPFKGPVIPLGQWLNIIRFLQETSQGSTNLVRKCYRWT